LLRHTATLHRLLPQTTQRLRLTSQEGSSSSNRHSPISGKEVRRHQVSDVVDFIIQQKEDSTIVILAENIKKDPNLLTTLNQQGFSRVYFNEEIHKINTLINKGIPEQKISIVIDRIIPEQIDNYDRIADSIQTAFFEGNGKSPSGVDLIK
jgi:excinuclease ABC subunit A